MRPSTSSARARSSRPRTDASSSAGSWASIVAWVTLASSSLDLLQHGTGPGGDVLARESEVLVEHLGGCGCAEALHGHHVAGVADPAVPAERARRLDGHAGAHGGREHGITVGLVLLGEAVDARHAHQAYPNAVRFEQADRVVADVDLRAGAHEDQLGLAAR